MPGGPSTAFGGAPRQLLGSLSSSLNANSTSSRAPSRTLSSGLHQLTSDNPYLSMTSLQETLAGMGLNNGNGHPAQHPEGALGRFLGTPPLLCLPVFF